jgi:hypothetical protein
MPEDRRGLRFLLDAGAEIAPVDPNATVAARATELSLRGCLTLSGLDARPRQNF